MTVPRVWLVDAAWSTIGNGLHGNRLCLDISFISDDVYVVATRIHKCHAFGIYMRRALRIVSFIFRYCAFCNHDQTVSRVRVPTGASTRLPNVLLHVHV